MLHCSGYVDDNDGGVFSLYNSEIETELLRNWFLALGIQLFQDFHSQRIYTQKIYWQMHAYYATYKKSHQCVAGAVV